MPLHSMGHGPDDLPKHLQSGGYKPVGEVSPADLASNHPQHQTVDEARHPEDVEENEEEYLTVDEQLDRYHEALARAQEREGYEATDESFDAQARIEKGLSSEGGVVDDADLLTAGFDRTEADMLIGSLKLRSDTSERRSWRRSHGKRGKQ